MVISVVVPVYNARRTIALCVDALLRQTQLPNAIYVVDNGSTDGTYDWLLERAKQEPRLCVLREAKPGPAAARNAALRIVEEGIVAFTDADCVPEPLWLASLLAAYSGPSVTAVAGSIAGYQPRTLVERYLSITGFSLPHETCVVREGAPFRGFSTANLSVRTDALRQVGGFDEDLSPAEDYDLCWRVVRAGGSIIYMPQARVRHIYRSTLGAMLRRLFEYGKTYPGVLRKHFGGSVSVMAGHHILRFRGPITLRVDLTSPEKVSLALIGLSVLSPWFLGLLGLYWVRLALRLKRVAYQRGMDVRSGGELVLLTGLHLLEFCATRAGSLAASPRCRVVCL